ncbi:alanine--tRNA ligase [Candidatus Pacearchaeota archaeon CG10_big_fil_rev_8_21_14_0_10_30_48]|nr:MAG: alanine--tRNA ligase [Candidatus Pacearchaeota archaeon CG10_big_fil_rev_8_21_14_0_10_30_48]
MKKITTREELIKLYLDFFKSKDHKIIPSSSLIPSNDPTVLFTTAGMHPLVPYLIGQKHPLGKRLANVQKCIRTGDIDEVGDEIHHTFFEMLGNWSLGDYWKKEAIKYSFEFLTKNLEIPKKEISITCFKGDKNAQQDNESSKIWEKLGIEKSKIKFLGKENNWWGPAGKIGPCGPDTEMFINDVEIWNDVFMQYNKNIDGKYEELKQKNVDTGMGVERTLAIINGFKDNYLTTTWQPIIKQIEKISKRKYNEHKKEMRIIADHLKAATFILAENIEPKNVEQGYVLRRLIRRAIRYGKLIMIQNNFTNEIAQIVIEMYPDYKELKQNKDFILREIEKEENRFREGLTSGLKYFNKISKGKKNLSGKDAFLLFQSYGFPIEITEELAKEIKIKIDMKGYEKEASKHQELSRTASAGKFKSGLADNSERTTQLHTATHLLNEALKHVLKDENIKQRGSNITPERLRFDFNFSRKLTEEEIQKIEDLVNAKIQQGLEVKREETSLKKAIDSGAQAEFGAKYPEKVSVYSIGEFSKEICTGPHVKNTKEIGHFKITKEESSSAGVRRIKATID